MSFENWFSNFAVVATDSHTIKLKVGLFTLQPEHTVSKSIEREITTCIAVTVLYKALTFSFYKIRILIFSDIGI